MMAPTIKVSRNRTIYISMFASLVFLAGCKDKIAEAPAPVRSVLVIDVKPQTTRIFGPFAGTVQPRYQSDQGFRTSGRMIARYVYVGDLVQKGERLASLDRTLLQFALTQSKSDIVNAEAQLKNANAAQERKRTLIQSGAVAQSDVDSASTAQKTAKAKLEQAQAAEKKAQDEVGYADLTAEFTGVVATWNAEVGQDVSEGAGVVTIARPDIREAVVDIPDDLIGKVKEKAAFTVSLQTTKAVTVVGVVREIAPSADNATRTRRVRFTLDHPSDAFRLGSTVTVSISSPIPPRFIIPESAVLERKEGPAVWAVAPGAEKVELRGITLTDRSHGLVDVSKGLGEGDKVVTAGIHSLKEGQPVKIVRSFP